MNISKQILLFFTLTLTLSSGAHSLHMVATLKNSEANSHASSLRHKIAASKINNKSPTPTQPEEDDVSFCTLANFQNCISELWPGPAAATAATAAQSTPLDASVNKKKVADSSEDALDATHTTTTTSAPMSGSDLAFPTSYRELQATCNDLKERVRCLDRHSERCFTPEMMQVFGHIVTNAKQFVHDLCDNKRVQSEFLIHAKCFRNISLDEQKCAQEYRDAINIPVSESTKDSSGRAVRHSSPYEMLPSAAKLISAGQQTQEFQIKELIMRRSCCALQELVLCKRRHVREQCGESAAIFMRDHLPRITNPVLEQHCSAYTYGPGTCDEALYRRRIVDGQLVVQSPYHNPFDRGSSAGHSSQQHLGNNRITRNQLAELDSGGWAQLNATPLLIVLLLLISSLISTIKFNL